MAVSVDIINQSKDMDLSLKMIVGDDLVIGSYDENWRFVSGRPSNTMVAFNPKKPGRGIIVNLDPKDRYKVTVSLNMPAATYDVELFVELVKRVATEWRASVRNQAKEYMPAEVFAANEENIKKFNLESLQTASQNIINGKADSFCVFGAFWPLYMGIDEAKLFDSDPSEFDKWLVSKQDIDAFYSGVNFYKKDNNVKGCYAIMSDVEYVFPKKPRIPFGMAVNGKPLECDNYFVCVGNDKEMIGEVPFDSFVSKLPKEKVSDYDINDILIGPFTEEELKAFL